MMKGWWQVDLGVASRSFARGKTFRHGHYQISVLLKLELWTPI
jgi:hypothetical protein